MPRPLDTPAERVTWRIDAQDMDLLRAIYPGQTNEVARRIVRAYCRSLRAKMTPDSAHPV